MRVLITGIDGFVGSHLAELLSAASVDVHGTALSLQSLRNIEHLRSSLTLHEVDITDVERVKAIFHKVQPERVLHIAGQAFVPSSIKNPLETFRVNILGGLAILEAVRDQNIGAGKSPSVLIVSSGEVYGRVATEFLPITEHLPLIPNNPYAASKASLDMIAQQYRATFGVDVIIVRPFNHAGPRQNPAFVISDFAKQFAEIALGKRDPTLYVGNVSVRRDFTDVRDVVRAYWSLFDRTADEFIFNVCSGQAVEIKTILDTLQELSGLNVTIVQEAGRLRPYDIPVVVASCERLRQATGWTPTLQLRQTVSDVYAYWLETLRSALAPAASSLR
jgi:GDP-4-dehydro-6-deoxy-D-mannose reductase